MDIKKWLLATIIGVIVIFLLGVLYYEIFMTGSPDPEGEGKTPDKEEKKKVNEDNIEDNTRLFYKPRTYGSLEAMLKEQDAQRAEEKEAQKIQKERRKNIKEFLNLKEIQMPKFIEGSDGIGYDLSGRSIERRPVINEKFQETGKVVISIKVDRNGNIISTNYSLKGSTTNSLHLINLAKEALRKARFNSAANAPEVQSGTITFIFKLK